MTMNGLVSQCMRWWEDHLQSIAELKGKVLQAYSDEDLMAQMKLASRPVAGLLYEGLVSAQDDQAKSTHRIGASGTIGISVILLVDGKSPGSDRGFTPAIDLMDQIRSITMDKRSPTNHFWRFVAEGQALEKSGAVVWVQRWNTPVQLVR